MTERERARREAALAIRRREAERRAHRERWDYPGRVRVVHPRYGTVIVPGRSKLSAILCAAEKWRVPWTELSDAQVWAIMEEEA